MKNICKAASLAACLFICAVTSGQVKKYTAANAHSHNDYLNSTPFSRAYNNGFGSIEADVFPVNGVLLVAHAKKDILPQRSLVAMYLTPLLQQLQKDTARRLNLLIDVKEDYKTVLQLLIRELEPLRRYLTSQQARNRLTILISGNRPPPAEYNNYPGFIFFDDDLRLHHTPQEWNRVGLVSLDFNTISGWKGEGTIDHTDEKRLARTIDSVHAAGKPLRFWAAPDTEASWKLQMALHADLIGTDKIDELARFLSR